MSIKKEPSKDGTKKIDVKGTNPKSKKVQSPLIKILRGIFSTFSNVFLLVILVLCIGVYLVSGIISKNIYSVQAIDPNTIEDSLTENSIIVDKNGTLLETLFSSNTGVRTTIKYEDIGQDMIFAITAIEDKTFFEHAGFNYKRLAKAGFESAISGDKGRGTSTITQQLAKNLYFPPMHNSTMSTKIQEAYYAIMLERALTKEQIIEAYLNKIGFGNNRMGVQAASMLYFSKDAKDLDLVESAILAGIPKANNTYKPMNNIPKAKVTEEHIIIDASDSQNTFVFNPKAQGRYQFVLKQMLDNELLSQEKYDEVINVDISTYIKPTIDQGNQISSYFADMVKDDVVEAFMEKFGESKAEAQTRLYTGGYKITSTIDFAMQKKLESIYESIDFSGYFDDTTFRAVKAFQKKYELSVDGSVGPQTLAAIVEQTTLAAENFTRESYSKGQTHDDIINLKNALNELSLMNNDNMFPRPTVLFDNEKNILNDVTKKVILYKYDNVINEHQQLIIKNSDYRYDENDNLILLKNKSLKFYQQTDHVQVVINDLFRYDETSEEKTRIDRMWFTKVSGLYLFKAKDLMIDNKYKTKVDGNLVIDKEFFNEYPDYFEVAENGDLLIDRYSTNSDGITSTNYFITDNGVIQPQSAFVVIDHHTGELKATIGGRESYGKNIFNRAKTPQQPGSSVKPIGAYALAIASGEWTAASVIDDVPSYFNASTPNTRWPFNWYEHQEFKYRGRMNLRRGIADSLNVLAVSLANDIGVQNIIDHFKNMGITSIQEIPNANGVSDLTLSAVALGGMAVGISPIELASAYTTFANKGVHIEPISFTKVTDLAGNIIIENIPEKNEILDEKVAYIVQDMMKTGVLNGGSKYAKIRDGNVGIPVAGKTGTTSDKRDVLFTGYTPYYTATVWFGNDTKLKMDNGSEAAAKFWSTVMKELHADLPDKNFDVPEGLKRASVDRLSGKRPSALSSKDPQGSQVYSEIFLPGTVPSEKDDSHDTFSICTETNLLATQYCTDVEERVLRVRLIDYDPEEHLDSRGNPILTKDHIYTKPHGECEVHTSEVIVEQKIEKVIIRLPSSEIIFIRNYNLLLNDRSYILVPIDSTLDGDTYDITFPTGERIFATDFNINFITQPQLQLEEELRILEEQNPSESDEDSEGN